MTPSPPPTQTTAEIEAYLLDPERTVTGLWRCIRRSAVHGNHDLRHRSALAMLEATANDRDWTSVAHLEVFGAIVGLAPDLESVPARIDEARRWSTEDLAQGASRARNSQVRQRLRRVAPSLEGIAENLACGDDRDRVRLAGHLRKREGIRCPHLAFMAIGSDADSGTPGHYARNARAATFADLELYDDAESEVLFALAEIEEGDPDDLRSRGFALTTYTRILRLVGRFDEAMAKGREAFLLMEDPGSAKAWLKVGHEAERVDDCQRAIDFLGSETATGSTSVVDVLADDFFEAMDRADEAAIERIRLRVRGEMQPTNPPEIRQDLQRLFKELDMFLRWEVRPLGY